MTDRQRTLPQQISKSILRRMHVVSISNLYCLYAFSILCRFLLQQQRSHEYSYTHSVMSCDNSRRWRKASIFMLLSSIHTVFILFLRSKSDFYSYWTVVFFVSTSLSFVFPIFVCLLQSWQSLKKKNRNAEKKIQYECIYDFEWIEVQWWKRKPFDQISSQIFMQNIRAFSITHFTKNIKRCRITFLKQVTSPGQTGSGTRSATVAYSPAIRESLV